MNSNFDNKVVSDLRKYHELNIGGIDPFELINKKTLGFRSASEFVDHLDRHIFFEQNGIDYLILLTARPSTAFRDLISLNDNRFIKWENNEWFIEVDPYYSKAINFARRFEKVYMRDRPDLMGDYTYFQLMDMYNNNNSSVPISILEKRRAIYFAVDIVLTTVYAHRNLTGEKQYVNKYFGRQLGLGVCLHDYPLSLGGFAKFASSAEEIRIILALLSADVELPPIVFIYE